MGYLKETLYKQLTKIGQELVVASNMGGLNAKDKKKYKSSLDSISKELSSNAIDDPSTIELLENNQKLLDVIPDKKSSRVKHKETLVHLVSLKLLSRCLSHLYRKVFPYQK